MAELPSRALCLALFAAAVALLSALRGSDAGVTWPVISLTVCAVCGTRGLRALRRRDAAAVRRVCALVLGDVGRSPRMQYHAAALSRRGFTVSLLGFSDTKPHGDILRDQNISIVPITEVKGLQVGPRIFRYATKVSLQVLQLLFVLLRMDLHAHILMQNPPGLPGMAVAWLVCVIRGSRLIVDWHNYGFTIMALSLGAGHPLVRLARRYEQAVGPLANHSLCVTDAMKDDLQRNWGISATTLHDRPAAIFAETPLKQKHQLFVRLAQTLPQFRHLGGEEEEEEEEEAGGVERTVFTTRNMADDGVTLRAERPALLLSSTSWTEDEDFSILLRALQGYEDFIRGGASLPSLVCVITGKGPQKQHYKQLIASLHLEHVKICTPWLQAEDYPVLLGSADLGVCLHKSSSGLDLPMKVVDMFGCCLPVCAVHFHCLHELVKHEHNGLIFRDAEQLAEQLRSLLCDFPSPDGTLGLFRKNLRASRGQRWDDNWDEKVLPLFTAP